MSPTPCWLVTYSSPVLSAGEIITIDRTIVMGRGIACDVRLLDEHVARRHVTFLPGPDGCLCQDGGSTNTTVVNGVPNALTLLHDGDAVTVGSTLFCFVVGARSRAEDVASEIVRVERTPPSFGVSRHLDEPLAHRVYESVVHRRPVTVLAFGWRRIDPVGLGKLAERVIPDAQAFIVGFRVFLFTGALPALPEDLLLEGVHVGMCTLAWPADHPGPYSTGGPGHYLVAAATSALDIAIAAGETTRIAEPVVLQPA